MQRMNVRPPALPEESGEKLAKEQKRIAKRVVKLEELRAAADELDGAEELADRTELLRRQIEVARVRSRTSRQSDNLRISLLAVAARSKTSGSGRSVEF